MAALRENPKAETRTFFRTARQTRRLSPELMGENTLFKENPIAEIKRRRCSGRRPLRS